MICYDRRYVEHLKSTLKKSSTVVKKQSGGYLKRLFIVLCFIVFVFLFSAVLKYYLGS